MGILALLFASTRFSFGGGKISFLELSSYLQNTNMFSWKGLTLQVYTSLDFFGPPTFQTCPKLFFPPTKRYEHPQKTAMFFFSKKRANFRRIFPNLQPRKPFLLLTVDGFLKFAHLPQPNIWWKTWWTKWLRQGKSIDGTVPPRTWMPQQVSKRFVSGL